jgi:hypothetical protein
MEVVVAYLKVLRKMAKRLIQGNQCPHRDSKSGPLEYEAGLPTTTPRHSVTSYQLSTTVMVICVQLSPLTDVYTLR